MKTVRRKPASIAKTRWAAYATAGAATALAGSNSAEAAIHYSGILNVHFPPDRVKHETFPLDQAGDSLIFARRNLCQEAIFSIKGIASAAFYGQYGYVPYVYVLGFGQNVSSRQFVHRREGYDPPVLALRGTCVDSDSGRWDPGVTGYVGFRFNSGAGTQYGWARVTMSESLTHAFLLEAYAYADVGERIRAGQISSAEQAPDESSLGWLALGAAGLMVWRKIRSRTARLEDV
jgi:hypothetical protein